jgi:hypothetical protein
MNRFRRIHNEFGTWALFRTCVLLVGLVGMTLFDFFAFSSIRAGLIAGVGLVLGFILRRKIPDGVEYYTRVFPVVLFIYPIVLFLGDRLGLDDSVKLAIITLTTVVMFDLQFWSLSDTSVINTERDNSV